VSAGVWLLFLVAAAGGACARYLVDIVVQDHTGGEFPWGTWVVNVTGSFVLGVITGLALYHALPTDARLVLGTGFCGGYTTFSTVTVETVRLAAAGQGRSAVRTVLLNTGGGLLAAAAGLALASL
jgi:CrcB protein